MVHSWVTAGSTPASSIHNRSASIKSGRAAQPRASVTSSWKMARSLFFLFAFLVLFSGLTLMHTFASTGEVSPASSGELVVSIDSGDTLWQLAKTYKKDAIDTRQAIDYILKRNGLSTSEVKVGQTIIIPARILS
ncbi:LysM peptidoglycan-binding domain-containing protein [Cohnella silvisoli]|uniref:LysM peptidoglycan-binding domain-containing protein n=1 Tax=Cohnella silvisoli TaxID=2873699 RepID=A0ABV1KNQ6_9BACL|nr:LysM peptidoglycan-binding domain-containing protein [Cohnella silvisoli]MCD9021008.1 LysM peptidoglycan-binding domain-containing protein [Cohnella silvisoli]